MFYNALHKLERRIERLENENRRLKKDEGIRILLDCNEDGENDPSKIYLLTTIPPRSQWKVKK